MNYAEESLKLHGEWKGKIEVISRVPVKTKDDLSLAYTPGVAEPCLAIQKDVNKSYDLTRRHNMCAVITDAVYACGDLRMTGAALMNVGVKIQLMGDYASKVMTFNRIE